MKAASPATYNPNLAYDRTTHKASPRPPAIGAIVRYTGYMAGAALLGTTILAIVVHQYILAAVTAFLSIGAFAMGGRQGVWSGECPDCGSPIALPVAADAENHAFDCDACKGRLILRGGSFHSVRALTAS